MNKKAIERFMRPIYCQNITTTTDNHNPQQQRQQQQPLLNRYNDQQNYLNCWRIEQNINGEQQFFQEGMSVSDLMYAYTSNLKFMEVEKWTNVGYCAHSDHTLGYFITFYHIIVPDDTILLNDMADPVVDNNKFDDIRRKNRFMEFPPKTDCNRGSDESLANEFRIYHYMQPHHMDESHAAWQEIRRNITQSS